MRDVPSKPFKKSLLFAAQPCITTSGPLYCQHCNGSGRITLLHGRVVDSRRKSAPDHDATTDDASSTAWQQHVPTVPRYVTSPLVTGGTVEGHVPAHSDRPRCVRRGSATEHVPNVRAGCNNRHHSENNQHHSEADVSSRNRN